MDKPLTSRERVWKALNFEEPDRVPLDIGGTKVTGITIDAYCDLVRHLELDITPVVYEPFGMLARMDEPIRRCLHSDVIEIENPSEAWGLENCDWKPWRTGLGNSVLMAGNFHPEVDERGYTFIRDANGNTLAHMPKDGLYFERACVTTLSDKIVKIDPDVWRKSIPLYHDEHLRILEKNARALHENTEYSIHGGFLKGMLGSNGIFAGHTITDWLCLLVLEPDYAFSILRATAERAVENLEIYLQAVGGYMDSILISGTDFGTQSGELFSPNVFRDLYVPNFRLMYDYVHVHSRAKTMSHSCGSILKIIDHFINAGLDILNPIQSGAVRMDPTVLKERFGGRIVFWGGGIDTQKVLPMPRLEAVREQARDRIRTLAPGGGFVFAAEHNIQHGVPPENIVGLADTVYEYGGY